MHAPDASPDAWAGGERYESYVGRWSRAVARTFVHTVPVPDGARWLDVGCGTGALTAAVLELRAPAGIVGVDPSRDFLARAAGTVRDPRARFVAGEALHLPADDDSSDAVVSGLVLNFVRGTGAALAEMVRVARRGGAVAAYVWDYAEGMELMRHFWDAAAALDAGVAAQDEGVRFPLCRPSALQSAFQEAGLADVGVQPIVVPTVFRDFDDYWTPFLGGVGPAPVYVASLAPRQVAELRDAVRERLPAGPDGVIRLSARAWAVRGVVSHGDS